MFSFLLSLILLLLLSSFASSFSFRCYYKRCFVILTVAAAVFVPAVLVMVIAATMFLLFPGFVLCVCYVVVVVVDLK